MEKNSRVLFKTLTWSIIAVSITAVIAFVLTGSVELAGLIVGIDRMIKIIAYYLHERAWL